MSAGGPSEQLYGVLQGFLSESKEARDASEQAFEQQWMSQPGALFPTLLDLIHQGSSDPIVHLLLLCVCVI